MSASIELDLDTTPFERIEADLAVAIAASRSSFEGKW